MTAENRRGHAVNLQSRYDSAIRYPTTFNTGSSTAPSNSSASWRARS